MTAGVQTSRRPARTALISSMAARMGVDIAQRVIFGKPKSADLGAFKADGDGMDATLTDRFNGLLTAFPESPRLRAFAEPGLKHGPHTMAPL